MSIVTPGHARSTSRQHPNGKDATALLKADHDAVSLLFAEFERAHAVADKAALVAEICTALAVHAQIEEEIFYPAVQAALHERMLLPEARVEHESLAHLMAQIEGVPPDGPMYDARVKVLSEYVKHHVRYEQSEIFPKARESMLDLVELGVRLTARRTELLAARR